MNRLLSVALAALAFTGCAAVDAPVGSDALAPLAPEGAPTEAGEVDLALDLEHLALVDDGPFTADEGAAIVPCGEGGVLRESGRVEVRTEWCDPADLAVVLAEDLPAGTLTDLSLSHDALFADGGEVHLALTVGDEVVWEITRQLPQPAAFVHERLPLARDHAAGERVVVHVHNHGANAYAIHGVRFTSP